MRIVTTSGAALPPTTVEIEAAKDINRRLADTIEGGEPISLRLGGGDDEGIMLPPAAVRILQQLFEELGRGHAVTLVPVDTELTTQQAAELLLISRPSLIHLLDQGELPYRRIGTHRRLLLADVLAFKQANAIRRRQVLDELAEHDQALGLE